VWESAVGKVVQTLRWCNAQAGTAAVVQCTGGNRQQCTVVNLQRKSPLFTRSGSFLPLSPLPTQTHAIKTGPDDGPQCQSCLQVQKEHGISSAAPGTQTTTSPSTCAAVPDLLYCCSAQYLSLAGTFEVARDSGEDKCMTGGTYVLTCQHVTPPIAFIERGVTYVDPQSHSDTANQHVHSGSCAIDDEASTLDERGGQVYQGEERWRLEHTSKHGIAGDTKRHDTGEVGIQGALHNTAHQRLSHLEHRQNIQCLVRGVKKNPPPPQTSPVDSPRYGEKESEHAESDDAPQGTLHDAPQDPSSHVLTDVRAEETKEGGRKGKTGDHWIEPPWENCSRESPVPQVPVPSTCTRIPLTCPQNTPDP
jgi:hypothetical protein